MAKITNFKDRIVDLTGTLVGVDDTDAMEQFILDGCYDVISNLEKSRDFDAMEFVQASSSIESGGGTDLDNIRKIYHVERDGINCRRISHLKRAEAIDANSMYEATDDDPVYYFFNNQIVIIPDSTASAASYTYYIPEYSLNSLTSGSRIDKFPNQYYEHVLLYASFMILGRQLLNLIQETTSDTTLSMDVISKMMNNDKPDSGGDVWDYLIDEDTEMTQATLQAIAGAMSITKEKYDWYNARMGDIRGQYIAKFAIPGKGGKA